MSESTRHIGNYIFLQVNSHLLYLYCKDNTFCQYHKLSPPPPPTPYSKYLMWTTFFWVMSRICYTSQGFARLAFSDTGERELWLLNGPCQVLLLLFSFKHFFVLDSFFISHQRPSSQLELLERQTLLEENRRIPFTSSLVSYFLANQYVKVFAPILDWSSITDQNSFVYNTLIKPSPILTAQV